MEVPVAGPPMHSIAGVEQPLELVGVQGELAQLLLGGPADGAEERVLDQMPQLEELARLITGEGSDKEAAIGVMDDDAFSGEQLQRLAHRHATRIKAPGQLLLTKPHARRQGTAGDELTDLIGDVGGYTSVDFPIAFRILRHRLTSIVQVPHASATVALVADRPC